MKAPSIYRAAVVGVVACSCTQEAAGFTAAAPRAASRRGRGRATTSALRNAQTRAGCGLGGIASRAACRGPAPLVMESSSYSGEYPSRRGLVFPTDKEEGWFDSASVGSPRVHRYYHDEGNRWVMWYHGQDTEWNKEGKGVMNVGTGSRIGRAESTDGLTWRRTAGQMAMSSVLDKNTEQWWGFDTAHVGLGDVNLGASSRVATESSVYFMYYFGGDYEETDVQAEFGLSNPVVCGDSNAPPKGVRMRIGVALSQDGLNWCRVEGEHPTGACVDVGGSGEWDRLFVGWPVVINHMEKEFRMYYHALDPDTKKFRVGMATSQDGLAWEKKGPVFDGGSEGSFDERGAGRRRIVMHKGVYHMVYEGVDKDGVHALGLATSKDGIKWERHSDQPIFERSPPGSGAWDAGGVSNPEIVETDGGMWYLYYSGHPEKKEGGEGEGGGVFDKSAIGVAVAVGDDLTKWTRLET
ncbi:unnamed protein product [Ectocarpus sp. 4 AP-2014]